MRTILSAISSVIMRSPNETRWRRYARRDSRAVSSFQQSAQRMPRTLFAEIARTFPEPPRRMAPVPLRRARPLPRPGGYSG